MKKELCTKRLSRQHEAMETKGDKSNPMQHSQAQDEKGEQLECAHQGAEPAEGQPRLRGGRLCCRTRWGLCQHSLQHWVRQVGGRQGPFQESDFTWGFVGEGGRAGFLPALGSTALSQPSWQKGAVTQETGWSLEQSYKWLIVSRKRNSVSLLCFVTGFI